MSKKHFIELANRIKANRGWFTDDAIDVLACFCQSQNHNFKRERWIAYINGEVVLTAARLSNDHRHRKRGAQAVCIH
jgi:hypothetical protein